MLHGYAQNQVWCQIVALACELIVWTQLLALHGPARRWEPRRLRLRLFSAVGRIVRGSRRMLAAKIVVFTSVTIVVGEVASFAAYFAGQPILADHAPHTVLGDPGVLRAVVGGGLYLGAVGLFSLAIGVLIRHTAGAITMLVAIALVIPTVMDTLPSSLQSTIGRVMPTNAGSMLWNVRHVTDMFSAWPGFGVLLGYAALLLVWAFVIFARRDT
jgi:hypothetical protein